MVLQKKTFQREVIPLLYVNAQIFKFKNLRHFFLWNWRRFSESKFSHSTHYSKQQLSILVQLSEKIFNGSLPKMQVNQINCDWKLKIELWHYGVLKVRNTLRFLFSIIWIGGHSQYTLIKWGGRGFIQCQLRGIGGIYNFNVDMKFL